MDEGTGGRIEVAVPYGYPTTVKISFMIKLTIGTRPTHVYFGFHLTINGIK